VTCVEFISRCTKDFDCDEQSIFHFAFRIHSHSHSLSDTQYNEVLCFCRTLFSHCGHCLYSSQCSKVFPARHPSCLSYHLPHQSQLNTQSSGLPPRMPSLLENPLTFFNNTRHPSQRYHLSFSTKKDCIFSRNTVANIDVAPHLPVRHIIT
jgi:hypothetical protein